MPNWCHGISYKGLCLNFHKRTCKFKMHMTHIRWYEKDCEPTGLDSLLRMIDYRRGCSNINIKYLGLYKSNLISPELVPSGRTVRGLSASIGNGAWPSIQQPKVETWLFLRATHLITSNPLPFLLVQRHSLCIGFAIWWSQNGIIQKALKMNCWIYWPVIVLSLGL